MKDPRYYVAQAADCRRLSLIAPDRLTASRLKELARDYDALVTRSRPVRTYGNVGARVREARLSRLCINASRDQKNPGVKSRP